MTPVQEFETPERRISSVVTRERRPAGNVFVKQYLPGDAQRTDEIVRLRTEREAGLLERLAGLPEMTGRLSAVRIVEFNAPQALLVTAESPGRPLQDLLLERYSVRSSHQALRAVYLAGKWLRVFQDLPIIAGDERSLSNEPQELLAYCHERFDDLEKAAFKRPVLNALRHQVIGRIERLMDKSSITDRERTWCHGDYAAFNVLWDGKTLTGIDFAMSRLDYAFSDATYFIHRLEMLPVQFSWRRWPVAAWSNAFLRGYGRPAAAAEPMYRAQMLKHLLNRLTSLVKRPGNTWKARLHSAWLRRSVLGWLRRAIASGPADTE
jgi:Phosphotransferase enzyme family